MQGIIKYITRGEVATLFGVSPHTVTRWARERKLPCIVTPGGQFRFPEGEVKKLLTRQGR
ncbi:MAG: helix-turn-helix domain-containing protein [Chloroflexi bacterium]|nr:helix-turn-helix domain-containing protein [Chloroflexota bacterium]